MTFSLHTAIPLNFYILNKYVHQIIQAEILDQKDLVFSSEYYIGVNIVIALKGGCMYLEFADFHIKALLTSLKEVVIQTIMRSWQA